MTKSKRQEHLRGLKSCIFCGQTGGISREHIFALWLKEFFPRDQNTKHRFAHVAWLDEIDPRNPNELREVRQGHVGSKKLRIVCQKCNNGWMSALEEKVKSSLPALIVGNRANIVPSGQTLLAAWACKTAMVADHVDPNRSAIGQEERTWLMNKLCPPANWYVWIGAYYGNEWHNLSLLQTNVLVSHAPVSKPSDAPYYAKATTFGVGHILFFVLSGTEPNMERSFKGVEFDRLTQIWPTAARSLIWPPIVPMNDQDAYEIANIFSISDMFDRTFDPGANWIFKH